LAVVSDQFSKELKPGAVGVQEKSESKETWFGITFVSDANSRMSPLIGSGGALFFCFFYFGRAKEKKEDRSTI